MTTVEQRDVDGGGHEYTEVWYGKSYTVHVDASGTWYTYNGRNYMSCARLEYALKQ